MGMIAGDYESALEHFKFHERVIGRNLQTHYQHRARCYLGLGDKRKALKCVKLVEKYGRIDPDLKKQIDNMKQKSKYSVSPYVLRKCSFFKCDRREVRPKEFQQCAKCRKAVYCSAEHQRLHWKAGHK